MAKIKVTINGEEIFTVPGKTILEVVHENKLDKIPTLCHDDRIEPFGSCFVCVVEVKGANKFVPACSTHVSEGMEIYTDNERIRGARKTALELLLSNHYADCIGPCKNNCPAGVDAQGYIALISMGKYEEALRLIKENNPLPLSIGRVCVRDCENACRRDIVEGTVGINYMKRFVADIDAKHKWQPKVKAANGKSVAVVGGGPAGLTCAYYLTLEGFKVTIYEKLPELGGMLKYGIPEYRLPKKILNDEIQWILDLGVDVKTNVAMGKDFDIPSLFKEGYDSVFLGVGAHKASTMRLKDEDTIEGIYKGIDFLREVEIDGAKDFNGTAVIVGGGNTAIDAARTALRCGAEKVKIVYRRSIKEMPAHHEEIHAAQEEGIEILFLTNPKSIVAENNKLKGIECLKMELVADKSGGRPRPVPIEGSEYVVECQHLIGAIGQAVDTNFNDPHTGVDLDRWGTIRVLESTLETSIKGVFAGGDVVTGPWTAIGAIAQGQQAAKAISGYLTTGKPKKGDFKFYSFKHEFNKIPEEEFDHIEKIAKEKMNEVPAKERITNFGEVELGLNEEQVCTETKRCLECGCVEYYDCDLRKYADEFEADPKILAGDVNKYSVDTRHPFVVMDPNKCINCGRCVRTCSEVLGVSALGFVHRGLKAVVRPAMEKPLLETTCVSCGNCIDTCPTGALSENYANKVLGTLPKDDALSVCNYCSFGCNINYKKITDEIYFVANTSKEVKQTVNQGYACPKGRFGYRFLTETDRLANPLVKGAASDWKAALDAAVKGIKGVADKHGAGSVAVIASPKLSNEELFVLQKMARAGLKTNLIGSLAANANGNLDEALGMTVSTASLEDLAKANVVVAMSTGSPTGDTMLGLKLKAAQRNGARVVVITGENSRLAKLADLWLPAKDGSAAVLMNGVANALMAAGNVNKDADGYADLEKMVKGFGAAKVKAETGVEEDLFGRFVDMLKAEDANAVFVTPQSSVALKGMSNVLLLTGRLLKEGNGLLLLNAFANTMGAVEMGAMAGYLPGLVKDGETVDLAAKLKAGDIKGLLVFGEDPLGAEGYAGLLDGVEFMMVMDMVKTATVEKADVVLPAASYIEQAGTYTACDGRWQAVEPVVASKTGEENWDVIARLASGFASGFDYKAIDGIREEIAKADRFAVEGRTNGFRGRRMFDIADAKPAYDAGEAVAGAPCNPMVLSSEQYFAREIQAKLKK